MIAMLIRLCNPVNLLVTESDGGVVVSLVDLGGLEDELVDERSSDATEDGSQPVDLKSVALYIIYQLCIIQGKLSRMPTLRAPSITKGTMSEKHKVAQF